MPARIGLAPGCDVAVPANTGAGDGRKCGLQLTRQRDQRLILRIGKGQIIGAFELDAHGKIVTGFPAFEHRHASMPRPLQTGDKLGDAAVTFDQKMRRDAQVGNPSKIGMLGDIQTILEKFLHLAGGELRRRQADVVDHQQGDFARGAFIEVG